MEGSGVLEARSYELPPFSAIAIGHGADLDVRTSTSTSTVIVLDDNLFDALRVEVENDTLRIELAPGTIYSGVNLSASIELPRLRGLELSGASTAWGHVQHEPRLDLELSGASVAEIEAETVDDLSLRLSGGSRAAVHRGEVGRIDVRGSGGSRAEAATVPAQRADVSLSGGSRAELWVERIVSGSLSGGSNLSLRGRPATIAVDRSGGSMVETER
jgi:hypothetical protein